MLRSMGLDPEKIKEEMEKAMASAQRMADAFEEIVKILERLEQKVDKLQTDIDSIKPKQYVDTSEYYKPSPATTGSPSLPITHTTG